ncbi:MAG: TonB-dependent receptor, partial [Candidatus Binatia bacterium]
VPISISVLGSEFIAEQNITDYRDVALYTPNAHIDPGNGLVPDINVRGFGSALGNKGFEQSVGLVLDGVPHGRIGYFQGPLFDIDRVELLRGPQGTLFGKNTTAGLLNVVTKKPTDDFEGSIHGELGELDQRRLEAGIGGPVVAGWLNFRVAALVDERDGIVENTTAAIRPEANERMNGRERKGGRFQLGAPDVFGASLVIAYERVDFDYTGTGWELDRIPEKVKPFYRQFDPATDFTRDNHKGSVDTGEFNRNDIETLIANASYDLAGWRIDAIGGRSLLRTRSLLDNDWGPAPMTFGTSDDDNPQTTGELRLTSPSLPGLFGLERLFGLPLGATDFTAGFFYQRQRPDDAVLVIDLNLPVFAQFAAYNSAPEGTPIPDLVSFVGSNVPIGSLGVFDTTAGIEETTMFFEQSTSSIAGFGHTYWRFAPGWTLQYGMRFTEESKKAHWDRRFTRGTGAAFVALGASEFTASRERSEFAFMPKVALNYDWSDDVTAYASWGRGVKAGGFNEQTFTTADEALEFDTEKATAWEIGAKTRLLDGAAAVNLALFWENVTDYQVLTVEPNSLATFVVNAGEGRARGAELDASWVATSWLTLVGTLGFNDAEFLSFPFGQCSFDRPDTDGNGDGRCDLSGKPLFRTPKWASTLTGNVRLPITSMVNAPAALEAVDLVGGVTVEYQGSQYLD